jgi:hypothetical protein
VTVYQCQFFSGFFYSVETTDAGPTTIDLPPGISPKAIYTLTILQNAPNPDGAQQFVSFLLGSKGSALLKEHGLALTQPSWPGPIRQCHKLSVHCWESENNQRGKRINVNCPFLKKER